MISYRDVLARNERLTPQGQPIWPLSFLDRPASGIEAAKPARRVCGSTEGESPVPERQTPKTLYSKDHPHA